MSTADSEESSAVGLDAQADDMALLRRYVDLGSQDAFNQLVSRHLSWVHATCRKGLRDRHMAEDAAQAVFIILARRAASIPPQTRLSGWLFNTARFVIKDAKKQETRYRRRENVAREMSVVRLTPVREPVDASTQAVLDDALATLTERDRLALLMHFYEGLSLQEMADSLGITRDGAKKRVARALSRLRSRMARNGKAAATVAVLAVLLRSRAATAAPVGLAQTVSSSATVPGVATSVAKWMAQRAMSTSAGASRRLLRALVAFELMTAATLVTVGTISARRHVAVTSVARARVAQVEPTAPAAPAPVTPPAPAKTTAVAAPEPVTPYRSGAFDPEPRVEPLPPFKDEPTRLAQTAPEGGGSGLVASSGGASAVSTRTTPAYGGGRTASAVQQQPLPVPPAVVRAAGPALPPIAPAGSSGSSASTGPRASAATAAPPATSDPNPGRSTTPAPPAAEPPVASAKGGEKGHKSWPFAPPVPPVPPPVAMVPPETTPVHQEPSPRPRGQGSSPHPMDVPPPPKEQPAAWAGEHRDHANDPGRGRTIVALAMTDDDQDRGFGKGLGYGYRHANGHIRREFVDETAAAPAVAARGRKHEANAAGVPAGVPECDPTEVDDAPRASHGDWRIVSGDARVDAAAAIAAAVSATVDERRAYATPFARAFERQRPMLYDVPAAGAADYAFSAASPAFFAEAVPEPSGLVVAGSAGLCGLLARRTRRCGDPR